MGRREGDPGWVLMSSNNYVIIAACIIWPTTTLIQSLSTLFRDNLHPCSLLPLNKAGKLILIGSGQREDAELPRRYFLRFYFFIFLECFFFLSFLLSLLLLLLCLRLFFRWRDYERLLLSSRSMVQMRLPLFWRQLRA
jgi:hypothetical protein